MIIPDINLLLYAHIDTFEHHDSARRWWEGLLGGDAEVGVPLPAIFGFIRIASNPRVFDPPMSVEVALGHVGLWMQQPNVRCPAPGPRHIEIAFRLLRQLGTAANLTTDAQLAAFAIEHQGELHSNDTDFGRFPGLRWRNPLE
jgi:toxin-antitoxin system PIN domain toxin